MIDPDALASVPSQTAVDWSGAALPSALVPTGVTIVLIVVLAAIALGVLLNEVDSADLEDGPGPITERKSPVEDGPGPITERKSPVEDGARIDPASRVDDPDGPSSDTHESDRSQLPDGNPNGEPQCQGSETATERDFETATERDFETATERD